MELHEIIQIIFKISLSNLEITTLRHLNFIFLNKKKLY